jgi:hypothetical protein
LPEFAEVQGDPKDYIARLTEFVASKGIALEYSDTIAPARGMSSGGKITLLPSLPEAERFSVLVHETAHLCCEDSYVVLSGRAPTGV